MIRTAQEWIDFLTKLGCLWIHDGNPKRPHAELTSGKHSNGFFNGSLIIEDPILTRDVCRDLLESVGLLNKVDTGIEMIFGSAHGATDLAFMMGLVMGTKQGFTEPQADKSMALKRFRVSQGTKILVVEDVMTTGGTTQSTIKALEAAGGVVLPTILVVCNRSGKTELDGRQIVALIDKEMPMWDPAECPLCKAGSVAIRPKGNWEKLTAEY